MLLLNDSDVPFSIKRHERIAQLVLEHALAPRVVQVEELDKTERGNEGFGSTGQTEILKILITSIKAISKSELLIFPGKVNGREVTVLLDGGSRGNFISQKILRNFKPSG